MTLFTCIPRHFCLVKKEWNSFRVCLVRNQFGLLLSMKPIVFSNGMYVESKIEVHIIIDWHLPTFHMYILQGTRLQERLL